jgi:type IV secretion system protein VirD4
MQNLVPNDAGKTVTDGASRAIIGSSEPDAITLGRLVSAGGKFGGKVCYGGERHLVLFGPNGTGKGMRILVPAMLTISGKSIVLLDPKAQLAAMTAKYRHEQGDDVKILDPFGVLADIADAEPEVYRYLIENDLVKSAGFNPLANLDPDADTFYEDAAVIGSALIKIEGNDPHWPESAQGLVVGLIMWEKLRNGDRAHLENVRQMLTEPDEWEVEPDGTKRERQVRGLRVTATQMVKHGGFEIKSLAGRFLRENNELDSIQSTADTQTRWLLSRPLRADLKKNGIDFRELKTGSRPMTVYVIVPSKFIEEHSIWLRLVISEALRASLTTGGRRVLLILDEFAALGHLKIIEQLWGVTRDYRVQMWAILQDLVQLKGIYKDRWETILGMAGVVQGFTPGEMTTAEWMSKRTGETTIITSSYNNGESSSINNDSKSTGLSYQPAKRPFRLPQDFFSMKEGYAVAWLAGVANTVPLYVPLYKQIVQANARALPNPYYRD